MRYLLAGLALLTAASASRADGSYSEGDPGGLCRADFPIEAIYDLAALTPEKALRLNGKRAVFRIEIIDAPAGGLRRGATSSYPWCRCADGAFSYVELGKDVHATSGMTVEATLNVLHYPPQAGAFPDRYYFVLSGASWHP